MRKIYTTIFIILANKSLLKQQNLTNKLFFNKSLLKITYMFKFLFIYSKSKKLKTYKVSQLHSASLLL